MDKIPLKDMLKDSVKYLRSIEWTRGNGQCDHCGGLGKTFAKSGNNAFENIGHAPNCKFAKLLIDLGEKVLYKGTYIPTKEELITRTKTEAMWKAMFKDTKTSMDLLVEEYAERHSEQRRKDKRK